MTTRGSRTNTPTEQNKEDNALVLYRLEKVELAVKEVGVTITQLNSPNKADYVELRDTILARINEIRDGLNKKIDENEKDFKDELRGKADKSAVEELKNRLNIYSGAITTIVTSLTIYFFSKLQG